MKVMGLLLISVIYKIIKIFKIKGDIKMKYLYEEYVQKNDKHGWWTTFFIDEDTAHRAIREIVEPFCADDRIREVIMRSKG